MKKLLSIILSIIVLISSLSVGFSAYAKVDYSFIENPFYTGEKIEIKTPRLLASEPDYYTYNGTKYYVEGDALYKIVRDNLANRNEVFTVNYYSRGMMFSSGIANMIKRLFKESTEDRLSVSSTDGDYARWSVNGLKIKGSSVEVDRSGYYYSFTLNFSYYATAEQEKAVDKKITSIVEYIRKQNWSDYETVKYIHDYICNNTTYNYDAVDSPYDNMDAFTAYGALVGGKVVCQGYANAFYRICKELGYKVRFVSSDPNIGCHAWNLIQLDDKYYFVDCTWDDEAMDEPEVLEALDNDPYYYFLVDYVKLKSQDKSMQHTLDKDYYSTDYYKTNYGNKTSAVPYDYELADVSTYSISLDSTSYTYNGNAKSPNVTIADRNGEPVTDYTVSYDSNKSCGMARAKISHNGIDAYRTFIIKPAKASAPALKSGTRASTSLTLTWKSTSADGFELQRYKDGAWKTVKKIENATSYKVTGLSPSTAYKFRVRAYKTINRIDYYGDYSNSYTTFTIPKNVAAPTLSTKSKAITVKWKKVACSGYEIQYSKNSNMSSAKTVRVSSSATSKKLSKLTKGKKYYVRIRAYKTYNNKKYYSSWSSKKSIVVK